MINAMRGVRNNDVLAAAVDVVECTNAIHRYGGVGVLQHVVFFDVMGSGALTFPSKDYFL